MRTIYKTITLFIIITMTYSCGNIKKKTVSITSTSDSTEVDWKYGWTIAASTTLDMDALKKHQTLYPERWKATFEYLKNANLVSLPIGEHEIIGREVYAIISEYTPKEEANCNFEAHRKYIDFQYLISGEEKMGVTTLEKVAPICDYNEEKDIVFFKPDAPAVYEIATPETIYVFFPKDAHRPSMTTGKETTVRKIVIKIKM